MVFPTQEAVRDILKRTAVALKQADVPFALCGGYAAWARGAPEPEHDADFLVPETEAGTARKAMEAAGLDVQQPAEDWLVKVVSGDAFVDVIWRVCGSPVETDVIERAEVLPVLSVTMPVITATDIISTRLMALTEQYCDYTRLFPAARALREQVDWDEVRRAVAPNDFASTFVLLVERMGVIEPSTASAR